MELNVSHFRMLYFELLIPEHNEHFRGHGYSIGTVVTFFWHQMCYMIKKEGIERKLPQSSNCFDSWNFVIMIKKKKGICTYKVNVIAITFISRILQFYIHISIGANFGYVRVLSYFKSCRIVASTNRTYSHHKIFKKKWLMSHAFWFKYSLSDIVDFSLNRNVFRTAILVGDFVIGHFTAQNINLL